MLDTVGALIDRLLSCLTARLAATLRTPARHAGGGAAAGAAGGGGGGAGSGLGDIVVSVIVADVPQNLCQAIVHDVELTASSLPAIVSLCEAGLKAVVDSLASRSIQRASKQQVPIVMTPFAKA